LVSGRADLRGPHDLRHTFATWLEDAAIPSRVIDELMGHTSGRPDHAAGGSPMGRVYRETTPAMVARVTAALDDPAQMSRHAEWSGSDHGCPLLSPGACPRRAPSPRARDGYLGRRDGRRMRVAMSPATLKRARSEKSTMPAVLCSRVMRRTTQA
jgi:hypothetical protein